MTLFMETLVVEPSGWVIFKNTLETALLSVTEHVIFFHPTSAIVSIGEELAIATSDINGGEVSPADAVSNVNQSLVQSKLSVVFTHTVYIEL